MTIFQNKSNFPSNETPNSQCSFDIFQSEFVRCSAFMDGAFCVYCVLFSYLSEEKKNCEAAGCNVHRTAQNNANNHCDTRKTSEHSLFVNCVGNFIKVFEGAQVTVVSHFDCQMNLKIANNIPFEERANEAEKMTKKYRRVSYVSHCI